LSRGNVFLSGHALLSIQYIRVEFLWVSKDAKFYVDFKNINLLLLENEHNAVISKRNVNLGLISFYVFWDAKFYVDFKNINLLL
jgi:hypothetical protein